MAVVKLGTLRIDKNALIDLFGNNTQVQQIFTSVARGVAREQFNEIKTEALDVFDNLDVTKEIEEGPYATKSILPLDGHEGNLFSFLGFYKDSDPIGDLRYLLETQITMGNTPSRYKNRTNYYYYFNVFAPDRTAIAKGTSESWPAKTTDSWVYAVQEGMSNLNQYLFSRRIKFTNSNSGPAVQSKYEVKNVEFGGTPYLSRVYDFIKKSVSRT